MDGKRIVVEFSEAASAELGDIQQKFGADDIGQVTVAAVQLFRAVVEAQKAGKQVIILDSETGERVELPSQVA